MLTESLINDQVTFLQLVFAGPFLSQLLELGIHIVNLELCPHQRIRLLDKTHDSDVQAVEDPEVPLLGLLPDAKLGSRGQVTRFNDHV